MINTISLNTLPKTQFLNQASAVIDKAPIFLVKEEKNLAPHQIKNGQLSIKDTANAIKEANVVEIKANDSVADGGKTKLQKAGEKLRATEEKMEKAIKKLQEKQEKVNSLKEKMKNASFFKKIGYAIAYGAAKAGLKIAELAVKAAEGYVLGL